MDPRIPVSKGGMTPYPPIYVYIYIRSWSTHGTYDKTQLLKHFTSRFTLKRQAPAIEAINVGEAKQWPVHLGYECHFRNRNLNQSGFHGHHGLLNGFVDVASSFSVNWFIWTLCRRRNSMPFLEKMRAAPRWVILSITWQKIWIASRFPGFAGGDLGGKNAHANAETKKATNRNKPVKKWGTLEN